MRALVRRVQHAEVCVDNDCVGSIASGLLVYLGICLEDGQKDIEWTAKKVLSMRVFDDSSGRMNLPISNSVEY